ncbi:hypothetical protein OG311_36515 [Streptomyces sp. NBC_01343]|uniref:hypothetical protein n=1 Tax=Streptomyces sp. NBC_01343 TaxID=2903832 RepID=UPI002E0E05A3|nr:hypothetical protein OG311_36515 [Streptomyces sp. NBC_01343]
MRIDAGRSRHSAPTSTPSWSTAAYRHRLRGIDPRTVRNHVENTVEHLRAQLGEREWHKGMNPEVPHAKTIERSRFGTD